MCPSISRARATSPRRNVVTKFIIKVEGDGCDLREPCLLIERTEGVVGDEQSSFNIRVGIAFAQGEGAIEHSADDAPVPMAQRT